MFKWERPTCVNTQLFQPRRTSHLGPNRRKRASQVELFVPHSFPVTMLLLLLFFSSSISSSLLLRHLPPSTSISSTSISSISFIFGVVWSAPAPVFVPLSTPARHPSPSQSHSPQRLYEKKIPPISMRDEAITENPSPRTSYRTRRANNTF